MLKKLFNESDDTGRVGATLLQHEFTEMADILMLTDADITLLTFLDKSGQQTHLPLMIRKRLSTFIKWAQSQGVMTKSQWEALDLDTIRSYSASQPPTAVTTATTPTTTSSSSHTPGSSALYEFKKGIKCSICNYTALSNDFHWQKFKKQLSTTAATHDLSEVLDGKFVPADADATALFAEKQKFMFGVFTAVLQTSKSKKVLRDHEDTSDAQALYAQLLDEYETGISAKLEVEHLETLLCKFKLSLK